MAGAFQADAFQNNAFQVGTAVTVVTSSGGFARWGPDTGRVRPPWNMLEPYGPDTSDDDALILLA